MRSLVLLTLLGCSSTPAPAAANVAPIGAARDEALEPTREEPKNLPCEGRSESWEAGLHDRYLFIDDKTELSGYKDKAGSVVIKPRFRQAYPFGPGGIAAVHDPKVGFGYIDPSGTIIAIAHAMDNGPDYFSDKLARIIGTNKKIGFIDDTGRIMIPPRFDEAMPFCDGKAEVELGGKKFRIDKTGATVAP